MIDKTQHTKEACLKAIEALELGEHARRELQRINPQPDVAYIRLQVKNKEGGFYKNASFMVEISLYAAHGLVHCKVDGARSIIITTEPSKLQEAYDYVKGWLHR